MGNGFIRGTTGTCVSCQTREQQVNRQMQEMQRRFEEQRLQREAEAARLEAERAARTQEARRQLELRMQERRQQNARSAESMNRTVQTLSSELQRVPQSIGQGMKGNSHAPTATGSGNEIRETGTRIYTDFTERNGDSLYEKGNLEVSDLKENLGEATKEEIETRIHDRIDQLTKEGVAQRDFGQSYRELEIEKKHDVDTQIIAVKAPLAAATGELKEWVENSLNEIFNNVSAWQKQFRLNINERMNELMGTHPNQIVPP